MVGVVSRKSFKTRIGRSFTPLLILVLLHGTASALDPSKSLTQYRLDVWKEKAGLPQSVVTDIVQTRDGYIWLATEGGLVRFDGVRFTRFDKGYTNQLKDNEIEKLWEDREGNLWIGTYGGGLSRLKDGNFTTYTQKDGLAGDFISLCVQNGNMYTPRFTPAPRSAAAVTPSPSTSRRVNAPS